MSGAYQASVTDTLPLFMPILADELGPLRRGQHRAWRFAYTPYLLQHLAKRHVVTVFNNR